MTKVPILPLVTLDLGPKSYSYMYKKRKLNTWEEKVANWLWDFQTSYQQLPTYSKEKLRQKGGAFLDKFGKRFGAGTVARARKEKSYPSNIKRRRVTANTPGPPPTFEPKQTMAPRARVKGRYTGSSSGRNLRYIKKKKRSKKKALFSAAQVRYLKYLATSYSTPKLMKKSYNTNQLVCAENLCKYFAFPIGLRGDLDLLLATFIQISPDSGETDVENPVDLRGFKQTKVRVTRGTLEVTLANNYQTPVVLDSWIAGPRTDNSSSMLDQLTNGFDDIQGSDLAGETNPALFPGHSPTFLKHFWLSKHNRTTIAPSDQFTRSVSMKPTTHSADDFDADATTHRHKFTRYLFIRMKGTVGKKIASAGAGFMQCQLDTVELKSYTYRIIGSGQIKRWSLDGSSNLATGLEQMLQDVPVEVIDPVPT